MRAINARAVLNRKVTDSTQFIGHTVEVVVERPIGFKHHSLGFTYLQNYGHVPGTLSDDGEELDAYVLGEFEPLERFQGLCIAVLVRLQEKDDKLIVISPARQGYSDEQIAALTEFQEKWAGPNKIVRK
ncbi:MAG: inorganic diphosphatase [Magnetococcales bacterium]|nr:inorganic diphosphatase [Magnetococcales bacterium]